MPRRRENYKEENKGNEGDGFGQASSNFLFINKTPSSGTLSRSSSNDIASFINSHAQRWKFNSATKKLPVRASTSRHGSRSTSSVSQKHASKSRRRARVARTSLAEINSDEASEIEVSRQDLGRQLFLHDGTHTPLFTANFSPEACVDPFSSTVLPLGIDIQPLLQYYLSLALLSTARTGNEDALNASPTANFPVVQATIRGCLSDEVHMCALLCAIASRMKKLNGVLPSATIIPELYLQKAIKGLRQSLSKAADAGTLEDPQIVLDMFWLTLAEWYMGSLDAAKIHFNYFRYFWNALKSQSSPLTRYLSDVVDYYDVFLSLANVQLPYSQYRANLIDLSEEQIEHIYQPLKTSSSEIMENFYVPASSTTLNIIFYGSGFNYARETMFFGSEMRKILPDLTMFSQVYQHTIQIEKSAEAREWMFGKCLSLLKYLTSSPAFGPELSCRIALVILLSNIYTPERWRNGQNDLLNLPSRLRLELSYDTPIMEIASSLPQREWPIETTIMLFWMLVTGLFAVRIIENETEYQWFLRMSSTVARALGLTDEEGIETILYQFLYLPKLQRDTVSELASNLI